MSRVAILHDGVDSYKSRAFLFPILRYRRDIEDAGFDICLLNDPDAVEEFDVLIVSDKVYVDGPDNNRDLLNDLRRFDQVADRLLWFDTTDGTTVQNYGTLSQSTQKEILPNVDGYYKKQLLADRSQYLEPLYGSRLFSDFYTREYLLKEASSEDLPRQRVQVDNREDLEKLGIFWNLGQNIYVPYTHRFTNWFFPKLFDISTPVASRLPWNALLRRSLWWASPDRDRLNDVTGRFTTAFGSDPIQTHRQLVERTVADKLDLERVSRREYWSELRQSKVLLSPFGWGEICHRDFEGFMSGCIVVKPTMDHLETWPQYYESGETILSFEWDMQDLKTTVERALNEYHEGNAIARQGQQRYCDYLVGDIAAKRFVSRFADIVNGAV